MFPAGACHTSASVSILWTYGGDFKSDPEKGQGRSGEMLGADTFGDLMCMNAGSMDLQRSSIAPVAVSRPSQCVSLSVNVSDKR